MRTLSSPFSTPRTSSRYRRALRASAPANLLETFEPRVLLSALNISGTYTSTTNFTLTLASDDAAIADHGTIFVDFGDNSGTIAHGTATPLTHTYADTQSHMITAYVADSLSIAANQTVSFAAPYSVLLLDNLTIANGTAGSSQPLATLDLTNRDMIIQCPDSASAQTTLVQVTEWLRAGFHDGLWDGFGVISSRAAADPLTAVGILNTDGNNNPLYTMFDGIPVDANSVLVKYTYQPVEKPLKSNDIMV